MFLQPPKIFSWQDPHLLATYKCSYDLLITSGCSFTASTNQLDYPASWPAYVKERCSIKKCIDMSYPGIGNLYIKDSIKHAVDRFCNNKKTLVIVMWTGLHRVDTITQTQQNYECVMLDDKQYSMQPSTDLQESINNSINYMLETKNLLKEKNIDFVFTSYVNLIHSPFVYNLDQNVKFADLKDKNKLKQIKDLNFVPEKGKDYYYEWTFFNNYYSSSTDYFHPPMEAKLPWVDTVLLPAIKKQGYIH